MRQVLILTLVAVVALGAGLFSSSPANAASFITIQQIGDCSSCSPYYLDGKTVCQLQSCRETGLTDPYGNPYVVCRYLCRTRF